MRKAREIWIEFGGDPSDDNECYKRYSATQAFSPMGPSDEVLHCIEFFAYAEAIAERDQAIRAMNAAHESLRKCGCTHGES